MNWRLQNPTGFRENIYTFNELAYPNPKGFKGNIYTFNELASPKSKGFQGKYIHKYDLDQNIIVRAWCNHICDLTIKLEKWTNGGAHTT